jgi:hypothetical protein
VDALQKNPKTLLVSATKDNHLGLRAPQTMAAIQECPGLKHPVQRKAEKILISVSGPSFRIA